MRKDNPLIGCLRIISCLLIVLLLQACTRNIQIRTDLSDCKQGLPSDKVVECFPRNSIENYSNFKLGFMEFDDQGWFYNHDQLHRLLKELNNEAKDKDHDLLVVVFVHGWRHNAQYNDENVQVFRDTLNLLASTEQLKEKKAQRKVFGIYVGWRGRSLTGPTVWESLSFYERKKVADYISKGSVRELFARLRHFALNQNSQKRKYLKQTQAQNASPKPPPKIRMVILGHSFGGLIVYSAISPYLMYGGITEPCDETMKPDSCEEMTKWVDPFVDLVFLINPAFEASRYEPLHHIATSRKYKPQQRPVFIAVTTDNDWATRYAFPLGRWINTVLEDERHDPVQKEANKNTVGHVKRYRTHTLTTCNDTPVAGTKSSDSDASTCGCNGWKSKIRETEQAAVATQSPGEVTALPPSELEDNLRKERSKAQAFYQYWQGKDGRLQPGWVRHFCGELVLRHDPDNENKEPENPFWIVYTDKSVIDGHGGLTKPQLRNFVHQILLDQEEGLDDAQ
jgi:hypothetical protein